MGSLFKPKVPVPAPAPPPPTEDEARAAAEARDELVRRRGRRSTVLTGDAGATAPTTGKPTLIGS